MVFIEFFVVYFILLFKIAKKFVVGAKMSECNVLLCIKHVRINVLSNK